MSSTSRNKAFKATAIALVAATSMTLAAPAFASGRHHGGGGWGGGGGYSHHGGGGYHGGGHDDNDDGLAAVALIGGLVLGAAFMSAATQPAYAQPVYAPQPSYGSSYYQQPLQATPTSDVYQSQSGQYCREYQSQANIGGRMTYGYGTACQQPDGSWRVVN